MANLFSGILMSVRDHYRMGDLVETNGFFGKIDRISLRSTVLLSPQGQEVIIPNKEVLQNPLINYSHNGSRRIDITCGVAYGDDLEKVKKVALAAIQNSDLKTQEHKPIDLFFTDFGDSSINFKLTFWKRVTVQRDYSAAQSQAIMAIKKAFDENGITIPFPITTLDFGVVGGVGIDELYPPKQVFNRSTTVQNGQAKNGDSTISQA